MNFSGIQKLSLVDYPEQSCITLFTSGCNMKCPFCHNASLIKSQIAAIPSDEITSFLKKRANLIDAVCISGGEPLLQNLDEISEFIKFAKSLGYKIKLDTNGTYPNKLYSLLPILDYIAMDIKSSKQGYGKAIGVENFDITPIEQSVDILMGNAVNYEFRTTYVGNLHKKQDALQIGIWLEGANSYRIQNYKNSVGVLKSVGLQPMTENELIEIKEIITAYIKDTEIR